MTKIGVRQQKRSPAAPFTTSTLQQEASRKLGFSPRRTMSVAQRLYEGIEVDGESVGLTTYMRTDSTSMAGVAMGEAREVIGNRYGPEYTMPKGRVYKTKAKGAQEAHEAIRPTSFQRDPDSLARWLSSEELRLYRLIWQRALASQMTEKRLETTSVELEARTDTSLRASATRTLFDGFSRVYTEGRDDGTEEDEAQAGLPDLAEGQVTSVTDVTPTQHFTEPPPRFTEATLIRALEEHGIGRPSTYAATISTIIDRGYVVLKEKRLHPELVAFIVTDLLVDHFGEFVDVEFTARMEQRLDEIARGEAEWVPLMREFYGPFKELVDVKRKELRRADITTEPSDEICSEGHPMVIRLGRNGRFLSCSLYPEHKESRPIPGEEPETVAMAGEGETCPDCGEGTLVQKRGRFGAVRRLLPLPRLQVHPQGRPAAARPAAVRGRLPDLHGGPSRGSACPPDRQRVLGLLALPQVHLHHARVSRSVPSTTSMPGSWRAMPTAARCASSAALRSRCRRPSGSARCWRADPPIPAAIAPSARRGGRAGGATRAKTGPSRTAKAGPASKAKAPGVTIKLPAKRPAA